MKLIVTGGSGFLGRHVCAAAVSAGHEVVVTSRDPDAVSGLPEGVAAVAALLTDGPQLARLMEQQRPDAVVHAAAVIPNEHPELTAINVDGTRRLCEALAALSPAPRLVHVSSFAVEDIPPTAYSASKQAGEEIVRASGLPFVVLRPGLIYGPGANTRELAASLAAGTHWLPGGGAAPIQPVFVEDAADAVLTAATLPSAVGQTYRLGGPEPVSVRAFREAVRDATGGAAAIRTIPMALFAPAARLAALLGKRRALGVLAFHVADHGVDSSAARADLGFAPRSLADGLAATFG